MNEHKIAVIGTGNWGKNLIRVCSELGVLAAIYDYNSEKAASFAAEYNVDSKTWSQILSDKEIDAVVIAVPAALHAEFVKQALDADKHVFVEKPLTMDFSQAKDLSLLAQSKNKTLMVGHILHYHNAYKTLKEMLIGSESSVDRIDSSVIGDIKYIESSRLHMGPIRYDAGIIWELLPHDISMLLGVINSPVQDISVNQQHIYPSQDNSFPSSRYGDVIDINIKFKNNVLARVYSSWLHPRKEQKFWVAGSKGMLVFEDTENWDNKLKLYEYNEPGSPALISEQKIAVTPVEPLKAELSHFIQSIGRATVPLTDGKEGAKVVELLQAIENKLENKLESKLENKIANNVVQIKHTELELATESES